MKKILSLVTTTVIALTLTTNQTYASMQQNENKDKEAQPELKDDVITYGGNLDSQQKDDVREKLEASKNDKSLDVTLDDVEQFTGVRYDHIYSSSVIEPKTLGKGVDVEIVTPDNITKITEEQYTNAAISAGIQNAKIRVASTVEPTTGDGALTGIVKAYAEEGTDLNIEDAKNANQEMSDLASISEENENKDGYSDAAMNNAVADMKEQVAEEKEKNNEVSEDKIRSIVDDVLKEKGLDNAITDNQRNTLYNIIINVANSNVLQTDPKAFKKQLGDYKDQLEKNHGDLLDKAKDKASELNTEENRNFLQKIWDAIVGFFQWLWNLISRFI
ncbi:DUF1002 domain-containing protein [Staphylococcus equorum]|uniref:DUF1002 domain-containing protein n=2 Tax=Staphylococcaceae TaxID=90964 RepID=A0A9X4L653_9STAP|nr:DUF1002 domain-containing protein [Staphylococcus equorum]MDG0820698.1 DUF1002 domain-containing protein [Staphylococcus equorum]MDG0841323.1 DUF1002 domain-containing protein [Staphylococcus equorum]MDG0847023.1 DUF1002 domain-containing protein [Staphylococcus equorum]